MCIFTGHVKHVAKTKLFVSDLQEGRHATIYQMNMAADEPVAMVLPVPTNEEVEFVNLEDYPDIFDDIAKLFPEPMSRGFMRGMPTKGTPKSLKVEKVGQYEASFVPTMGDFDRLDPRFRLPGHVVDKLAGLYTKFGFAVFQLHAAAAPKKIHPMAYVYKTNRPGALWFPTKHVHHEAVEDYDDFDHVFYTQSLPKKTHRWTPSPKFTFDHVDIGRMKGLVLAQTMYRWEQVGHYRNTDIVIELQSAKSSAEARS